MTRRILSAVLILLSTAPAHASLGSRLEDIRRRLEALKHALTHTDTDRGRERTALRQAQQKLGRAVFRLRKLKLRQQQLQGRQTVLAGRIAAEQAALLQGQHMLALDLRTAYVLQTRNSWQLLLDQKQPEQVRRMLTYYRYVSDAVGAEIEQTQQSIATLNQNQHRLYQVVAELKTLSVTQSAEEQTLSQDRRRQAAALALLNRKVASQQQQLRRLQQAARRLQRLVARLRRRPPMRPVPGRGNLGRGALPVPVRVRGWPRIAVRQGPGIFIPAPSGSPVHAVYAGRAVYAGWLRGFGLMLILEHEGGYMTIYAHAQSLFVHVGAVVASGEVIAAAGSSGGFRRPGLYFEIRHNGRPLPALDWLRR